MNKTNLILNLDVTNSTPDVFSAEVIATTQIKCKTLHLRVVDVLEEDSGLTADFFLQKLGSTFYYPVMLSDEFSQHQPSFDMISYHISVTRGCVLLLNARDEGQPYEYYLVFSDPLDHHFIAWAQTNINIPFTFYLARKSDIDVCLSKCGEALRAIDGALPQNSIKNVEIFNGENLSLKSISEDSSTVVRLVNSSLYDGLQAGASDIHLETNLHGTSIKYRIDGVLTHIADITDVVISEQVISRIKIMAELDISEKRVPQDGRFRATIKGREVDFRVSIMPCIFGEDAVLRILDRKSLSDEVEGLSLVSLGFDQKTCKFMRRLAKEPYGMVLVTGPTGSGKTTTLYALISEINNGKDKIVTIEDPVEYQLSGVTQIPVNEKKGLTFAKGLRSILRHDPDKILVGEIRDADTAQIAVQSALTGHLVFTTVHANNVFDVIGRFIHMGVDTYSFVSALNGIIAQRLLRVICTNCKEPHTPEAELLLDSGITTEEAKHYHFMIGKGCGACRGTGYKGRKAIAEFMHLNDEIRQMIVAREPMPKIKEAAIRSGTQLLRISALDLVMNGTTTLEEINRVTFAS